MPIEGSNGDHGPPERHASEAESDQKGLGPFTIATYVGLPIVGFGILLIGSHQTDSFWQSICIEIGAGVGLFTALFAVQRYVLEREVGRVISDVDELTTKVDTDVADLTSRVTEAESTILSLKDEVSARLAERRSNRMAPIEVLRMRPEFDATLELLVQGRQDGVLSRHGIVANLGWVSLRWRSAVLESAHSVQPLRQIRVAIEAPPLTEVAVVTWAEEATAADFALSIADHLRRAQMYPGDAAFDPEELFTSLVRAVQFAYELHLGTVDGFRTTSPIEALFDLPDDPDDLPTQWAITDRGIECVDLEVPEYAIDSERLDSDDWEAHMLEKKWVDPVQWRHAFDYALVRWNKKRMYRA